MQHDVELSLLKSMFIKSKNEYSIDCLLLFSKIHILGSYQNIQNARTSICNLILGSPPSKVYGKLRTVAARTAESF
jgi:rRNA processing protein Krr1/Pno1